MEYNSRHQGSTRSGRRNEYLQPEAIGLDERTVADFLRFIREMSRKVVYYDLQDEPSGTWEDFFISDECFILADIVAYDLLAIDQRQMALVQAYERFANIEDKRKSFEALFGLVQDFVEKVNTWYTQASGFHKQRGGSAIEEELASAIDYSLRDQLHRLIRFESVLAGSDLEVAIARDYGHFHPIWRLDRMQETSREESERLVVFGASLGMALKHLVVTYRTFFRTLTGLSAKAPGLLRRTLEHDDRHQPHIGLLLAFLELYGYLQQDLNHLTYRHLHYYYQDVLRQQPLPRVRDKVFLLFGVAPDIAQVVLRAGMRLQAGQNPQGFNRTYALERDTILTPARIASLKSLFVSRDPNVDQYSRFRMVSGLYASPVANSPDGRTEGEAPLTDGWPSLGEEQRYFSAEARTMPDARMGFAIGSSCLLLGSGQRKVMLQFKLSAPSIQHLTTLLIDIAQTRQITPEEVFHEVFSAALTLQVTVAGGWWRVPLYRMLPPADWTSGELELTWEMSEGAPAIVPYTEEVHQAGFRLDVPVVQVLLEGLDSFHPYSFLEAWQLEEVRILARVEGLRDYIAFNHFGPLDPQNPVELFGPIPRAGSYFQLGHEELFCKPITKLEIGWTYEPFPIESGGLKQHYAGYNRSIDNSSFRMRLSALQDFRYQPLQAGERQEFQLFESEPNEQVRRYRRFEDIDLGLLSLIPDGSFMEPLRGKEATQLVKGLLKFELTEPAMGFGFDVYPARFAEAVTQQVQQDKSSKKGVVMPQSPLAPRIHDIQIAYSAQSSLVFDPRRSHENDPHSGDCYLHILPFGYRSQFDHGLAKGDTLIPVFMEEGELYIGLEEVQLPQTVDLLFELTRSGKWEFGQELHLQWSYLSFDTWHPFMPERILEDGTRGLIETGILRLELGEEMTRGNTILPGEYYWIKAAVPEKAELLSRVMRIAPNASVAVNVTEAEEEADFTGIPADTIESFVEWVPGVSDIQQPFAGFGGRAMEEEPAFYARVSETLRHKRRCITRWDFERMALARFDWLSQVKCVGHQGNSDTIDQGDIVVVAIPRVGQSTKFYEPKLSPGEIKQIEAYLRAYCSPFVRLVVRNPNYEYVRIKCKVMLEGMSPGLALKTLYQDILHYICPWFYQEEQLASLGGAIKRSELIKFIQSRPYIGYLTGISIVQFQVNARGEYLVSDSALQEQEEEWIQGSTPWSVLVPSQYHDIGILQEPLYLAPEPTSYTELRIGRDFVVPSLRTSGQVRVSRPVREDDEGSFQFTLSF